MPLAPHLTPLSTLPTDAQKQKACAWFAELRDKICKTFEDIEREYAAASSVPSSLHPSFSYKDWQRVTHDGSPGGGGAMAMMKGQVFEKVGVNISNVYGTFSPEFRKQIPGAESTGAFWAIGISLVAHMQNPFVAAVHMNTRCIVTSKSWFGGGTDLNPVFPDANDTAAFHARLKAACDAHGEDYYPRYKKWCDEYFFIPHRGVARGVGGIFYDDLNTGDWEADFAFTQDVGRAFLDIYPALVRQNMHKTWGPAEREAQLIARGRYAEFNLVYDRGTKFGLATGGNVEAILMSLPPEAKWP
jgi:coproporphyrinogen III oxidase